MCICLCFQPQSSAQAADAGAFRLGALDALGSTAALPLVFSLGLADGSSFVTTALASCISTENTLLIFIYIRLYFFFPTKQNTSKVLEVVWHDQTSDGEQGGVKEPGELQLNMERFSVALPVSQPLSLSLLHAHKQEFEQW